MREGEAQKGRASAPGLGRMLRPARPPPLSSFHTAQRQTPARLGQERARIGKRVKRGSKRGWKRHRAREKRESERAQRAPGGEGDAAVLSARLAEQVCLGRVAQELLGEGEAGAEDAELAELLAVRGWTTTEKGQRFFWE